jgi:hypothetical protein
MTHPLSLAFLAAALAAVAAYGQGPAPTRWNVAEAGAVGDGQTDCTAIFQQLLDEAGGAGGGVVEAPAGRFRLNGTLVVPANVTLQGIFRVPPRAASIADCSGSVLLAYAGRGEPDGPAFIRLAGSNAAVVGFIVAYPEWRLEDVPPVPYPPCVLSRDTENVSVRDCLLLNPYEGIRLERAHRHLLRNITGYPIWRGIYVDECYDIGHIENIHFWPFGTAYDPNHPYSKWINTQGVAFELARTDWEYVSNTFCFGYGIGYRFSASPHGSANGNFSGLGADCCDRAVVVEQAQSPGLLITNGEFVGRWAGTESVCIEIGPQAEGKVSLVNCSFWGPIDRCVWMRSPVGQFTASACNFVSWDVRGAGSPALQLDAGRSIVQGCTFIQGGLSVQVGGEVVSAILTANQAAGGFRVENRAGDRTQMGLNEADPVAWTEQARCHYRIEAAAPGDDRYLRGFHGRERVERPCRWSMASSSLVLPAPLGKPYTVTLEANIPAHALSPEAGLYRDGALLAPLEAGRTLTASLPAGDEDLVRLELRCKGWVPQELLPGSTDPRTLGVMVFSITVKAADAGETVFDANTGKWLAPGKATE